jgi:hypothetical protein
MVGGGREEPPHPFLPRAIKFSLPCVARHGRPLLCTTTVSPTSRRKTTPGVPLRFRSDQRGPLSACLFFSSVLSPASVQPSGAAQFSLRVRPRLKKSYLSFANLRNSFQMLT